MTEIGQAYQVVTLNGNRYAVISAITQDNASEFAATITQAPPEYDQRNPPVSTFTMKDWTGGLGIKWATFREHVGRFWWSDGLDTRFPGQLTLGPLVQQLGATQTLDYNGALRSYHTTWKSKDFFSLGERIYRNDSGTLTQVFDWGTEASGSDYPVEGLVPFTASDGTARLYALSNNQRFFFSTNADGTPTWTRADSGVIGRTAFEFDRHLIICDGTTNGGELAKSTAPDGAAASYTSIVNLRTGGTSIITGTEFLNRAGEPTPFFVVADDTGGEQSGLWALDFYALKAYPVPMGRTPRRTNPTQTADAMTELVVWNGSLWVPDQSSLLRVNQDWSVTDVSPVGEQGLPPGYLEFGPLAYDRHNLYCAMGSGSYPLIAAYTGTGLHALVESALTTQVAGISVNTSQTPPRLYWTETNGTSYKVMFVELPVTGNPINDAAYKYAAEQLLITPWYDLGFADLTKTLLRLECSAQDLTAADEVVEIEYQTDGAGADSSGWTSLGTFSSSTSTLTWASGAGLAVTTVRFRITLSRGTTNTKTPIVRALTLRYIVNVPYRLAAQFVVDIRGTLELRGAPLKRAQDIVSELETAFESTTLVNYQFGDDTAKRVKVVTFPVRLFERGDGERDGTITIQVMEPVAS